MCSILLCSINVFNTLLVEKNNSTLPYLQLMLTYGILFITHIFRFGKSDVRWIFYVLVSAFNCAGDVTAIYAYNTTSLASAMLLTTTVIFWVAPLSFFVLKRRLSLVQLLSLVIGICGVVILFIADGTAGSRWVGNVLSVVSAMSYAVANILQEKLVYAASPTVYLCRFSLFAFPVSGILCGAIEWRQIRDYDWSPEICGYIIGYALLLFAYYTVVPFIMQFSSAMEMNISLLTANFFSLAISILAFGQKAEWLYLLGFAFVPVAIVLFTVFPYKEKPKPESTERAPSTGDGDQDRDVGDDDKA